MIETSINTDAVTADSDCAMREGLDLDPQTLCEEFERLQGRFYRHETFPEKEALNYAWRVILGKNHKKACEIRDEIMECLKDNYEDSVQHEMMARENRERFLRKN